MLMFVEFLILVGMSIFEFIKMDIPLGIILLVVAIALIGKR